VILALESGCDTSGARSAGVKGQEKACGRIGSKRGWKQ